MADGKERKMKTRNNIILLYLVALLSGCGGTDNKHADTPTAGEIKIVADESYKPLIQVQVDTFMEIYKYAKIHVTYLPEAEVFEQLLNNDSVRVAVVARNLDEGEEKRFEEMRRVPRVTKVAEDAVAIIVNQDNPDSSLTYENLGDIISGKKKTWRNNTDSITIVFDRSGSSNARYLKERFLGDADFPKNVYATSSNAEVVNYISENKNALGVISVNWISDMHDSTAGDFLKKIQVVALSMPDTSDAKSEFNKPYQAYIALKTYPLTRDVLMINREGRAGLGTGFVHFVAGDKGQRMIRLMGLLPATMPVRIINAK